MPTSAPVRSSPTFRKLSEIGEWSKQNQGSARKFALRIDLVSSVVQRTLARSASKGNMMERAVANFKARRAIRQYRRAAAHMDAAADCIGLGWNDILEQFHELIEPKAGRKDFDWQG